MLHEYNLTSYGDITQLHDLLSKLIMEKAN